MILLTPDHRFLLLELLLPQTRPLTQPLDLPLEISDPFQTPPISPIEFPQAQNGASSKMFIEQRLDLRDLEVQSRELIVEKVDRAEEGYKGLGEGGGAEE